jgi:hypothetical protein
VTRNIIKPYKTALTKSVIDNSLPNAAIGCVRQSTRPPRDWEPEKSFPMIDPGDIANLSQGMILAKTIPNTATGMERSPERRTFFALADRIGG